MQKTAIIANRKAQLGQIIIFVACVAITSGFVFAVYVVGNSVAAELLFKEEQAAFSLVAYSVVNSPGCLLYTETKSIGGETALVTHSNVIDWDKASDSIKECARKGPYTWNAVVEDKTESQTAEIKNYGSECSDVGQRSFKVTIKKNDKFNKGEVKVLVASKNAMATIKREARDFNIEVQNTGTCKAEFAVSASIVDAATDDESGIFLNEDSNPVQKYTDSTGVIDVGATASFKVTVPEHMLADYSLKIEVGPNDIPYYTRVYRWKL